MSIIRDKDWLNTEISFIETLYDKLAPDTSADIDIPTPDEFFMDPTEYMRCFEDHTNAILLQFQITHADSLAYEQDIKRRKVDALCMTEDEKIAAYLKEESEILAGTAKVYTLPPASFETDRAYIRDYFNSEVYVYLSNMVKLKKIMEKDFPDVKFEYEELNSEIESRSTKIKVI